MQVLKELSQLLRRYERKLKNYRNPRNQEMLDTFEQMIYSGKFETNEEASEYLFHEPPTKGSFRKLKERMRQRFLDSVLVIDMRVSENSLYDKAYVTAWKEWAATKILLNQRAAHSGSDMAHRLLKEALYFEFTELCLGIARVLRSMYATRFFNVKKFKRYQKLVQQLGAQYEAETTAEGMYYSLVIYFVDSKSGNPEIAANATQYCQTLAPYVAKNPSYRLLRLYHQIRVISVYCNGDYQKAITYCDEALTILSQKPFFTNDMGDFFYFHKIACHTQLNQYAEGRVLSDKVLLYESIGSYNWFKNRELAFLIDMHAGNYLGAYYVYSQVLGMPSFKHLDAYNKELWKIYEAFLMFLYEAGLFTPPDAQNMMAYRISKFLNEVPIFSQDKRGMNIPILIVQIMFALARKRYDIVSSRIQAVTKYASRYVLKDEMERSNLFIRMLSIVDQAGYNRPAVIRKAQLWHDKLTLTSSALSSYQIEVIPYETLWEITLNMLDVKATIPPRGRQQKKRVVE